MRLSLASTRSSDTLNHPRRSLRKVLTFFATRMSFGRLFHTWGPLFINDLSLYLVVRVGGTIAELSCFVEYWVCFIAMRS